MVNGFGFFRIRVEAGSVPALERPDVFVAATCRQVVGNAVAGSERIGERQCDAVRIGRNLVAINQRRGIEDAGIANGNNFLVLIKRDCVFEDFLSRRNRPSNACRASTYTVLISKRNHAVTTADRNGICHAVEFVGVDATFLSPTCGLRADAHVAVFFAQGVDVLLIRCLGNVVAENQIVFVVVRAEFDFSTDISRNTVIAECRRLQRNCLAVSVNLNVSLDIFIARREARSNKLDCGVSKVEVANSCVVVDHGGSQRIRSSYNKARRFCARAFVSEDATVSIMTERGDRGVVTARRIESTDCKLILVAFAVVGDFEFGVRLEAFTQNVLVNEGDVLNRRDVGISSRDVGNVCGLEGSTICANDCEVFCLLAVGQRVFVVSNFKAVFIRARERVLVAGRRASSNERSIAYRYIGKSVAK